MNSPINAALKLLIFTLVALVLAAIVIAIVLPGCAAHTASTTAPRSIYGTVTPEEYDAAETAFSGASAAPRVEYWSDYRCQELLDKRDRLSTWAVITGSLAGVGGISTAISDKDVPQWCLGAVSLAFGSASAGLSGAAVAKTRRFEEFCSAKPAVETHVVKEITDAGAE